MTLPLVRAMSRGRVSSGVVFPQFCAYSFGGNGFELRSRLGPRCGWLDFINSSWLVRVLCNPAHTCYRMHAHTGSCVDIALFVFPFILGQSHKMATWASDEVFRSFSLAQDWLRIAIAYCCIHKPTSNICADLCCIGPQWTTSHSVQKSGAICTETKPFADCAGDSN